MVGRVEADDPVWEEVELAAGFARRDHRRGACYTLADAVRISLGLALLAGGLIADSVVFIVGGAIFIVGGLWALRGTRQVARAEHETIARDRSF